MSTIRRIARSSLFVSEPDPRMFGNSRNEPDLPGWTNKNWLKSRFHFSFAEWRDGPSRYGALRVLNDDLVQPRRGFGTHGHSDMEIVTLVVTGELSHADSMGSGETLGRGSIQYMSAGEGVNHSEQNAGAVPVRFIQSWVVPRTRGAQPVYGSLPDSEARRTARHNKWEHIGKENQ
jgi:redox-sensitive bicupin YhaK (pirin superfamily)